jgi:excisionase family DNA binding protein
MARSVFVNDAAALLGVSRRTVYYWIRDGRLETMRTPGGSQRVLLMSIEARLREEWRERLAETEEPLTGPAVTGPAADV